MERVTSFANVLPLHKRISPAKIILGSFLLIILAGTLLLMLPVCIKEGNSPNFIQALFTATSATCVTGLSVVDTLSHWTRVGHIVILLLIQCGGLGFMAFATVFSLALHRRISLRERLLMTQSFSVDEISGVVRLTKRIIVRTLIAEGAGAALLAVRFVPKLGWGDGLFRSVFHSVSAFCNAGFDLMGAVGHNGSMSQYISDPIVCLTLISLMVYGGLGFLVWEDLRKKKSFHALTLHTKLVIVMTSSLLILGAFSFFVLEYANPNTFGELNFGEKLLASFFQSATTRTAGFYTASQAELTASSKMLSILLMFIGGSPGSTAGGIKTVTLAVLLLSAVSVMRGKETVTTFERKIPTYLVLKALSVALIAMVLVGAGVVVLVITSGVHVSDAVFECVSAFSTTGLSTGITASLHPVSKIALILLMYFGRMGLLTLSIGLLVKRNPSKISYPDGKIIIG